jgi:protein O-GlcNAc transferase
LQASDLKEAAQAHQEGRWEEAEAKYREALRAAGESDPVALTNLGQLLRQLGRNDEAIVLYERATQLPDAPAATWFNLGNAQFDASRWADAQESLAHALELDPLMEPAALQLARCAVNLGDLFVARERFAVVLRGNPKNFSAWLESGHLCRRQHVLQQAIGCYRRAVEVAPQRWVGHASLARVLEEESELDAATVHRQRAIACPDSQAGLLPLRMLGRARMDRGDYSGAASLLSHALAVAPEDHETMMHLGDVLMRVGDVEAAQALFEKVGQSDSHALLTDLAGVLFRYNYLPQAENVLREMVGQAPEDWTTHYKLAKLLIESWRMEEGLRSLDEAERLVKTLPEEAKGLRASAAAKSGDADVSRGLFKEIGEAEGIHSPARSSAAMASLYSDTMSALDVAKLHRELFAPLGQGARQAFERDRSPTRRLRVGYVTADLHHQHPVNIFMQPMLARHDAKEVEITVYFVGVTADEQSRLAKSRVHRWREAHVLDDVQLARQIDEDQIDILIDLIGHTSYNRRQLFGKRAAPVQMSFLGYPGSTGIPNMDWIVADAMVAPAEEEPLYSERVARLPHCVFCYSPEADYPYPAFDDAVASRPLTFGSFNNISKLTPKTIALWSRVMAAVPDATLLLKAPSFLDTGAVARFTRLFGEQGVEAKRLRFAGPTGLADMMAAYGDVDIALDTMPYTGGTTTYQALWMGAPVITLRGHGFCQRMSSSILTAIDRSAWIADSEDGYVEAARRLASDRVALLEEKRGLRERMMASPALDIDRYTRDMEGVFRMAWTDWCRHEEGSRAPATPAHALG